MKSQVISLKRRISLVVLTIVMALSAVFGAIFLRGILGDTAQTASADEFESYTVGATDKTTGYLGAFSTRYELTSGNKATYSFTVYSTKANNWNYWVACVASANNINPDIVALRADNYDNIQNANTGIASNFNWDTFKDDMHGATVSVNFAHFGDNIKVRADITTSSGKLFYEEFSKSVSGGVYVFLTVDNSYLNISNEEVLTNNISLKPTVGKTDNTTDYNASQRDNQSDNLLLKPGQKAVFEFVNYSSKGAAAYNWHACAGTTKYNYPDAVIFGANKYDRSMSTSNGVTSSDNYNPSSDSFLNEMDGSSVVVTFTYVGTSLTIHADITSSSGVEYWEELTKTNLSGNKYVFLTVEKSHLIVKKAYLGVATEYSKYDASQHNHNTSSYSGDGIATVATKENHTMLNGVCSVCGYTYEFKATVGDTNNTTAYRGDTSEKFALTAGQTAVFNFKNYSDKVNNWDNWIAHVTNANNQDQVLLRADNYEIVQGANTGISSNYNWDTFKDEMDGSDVVLSFTYTGSAVTIRADMTAANGTERYEEFTKSLSGDFINVALTVEKAHLVLSSIIIKNSWEYDVFQHWNNQITYSSSGIVYSGKTAHTMSERTNEGVCSVCGYTFKTTVGTEDNTSGFFADKSGVFALVSGETAVFKFTNNSAQVNKWDNWMVGVVNDTYLTSRNASDELVVLRADYFEQKQENSNGIISNFVPEVFIDEVHEASIEVTVTYIDNSIAIRVDVTPNGAEKPTRFEKFTKTGISESVIYVFISGNASYQTITEAKVYTEQRYVNYISNSAEVSIPKDYVVAAENGHYYFPSILPTPLKNGYDFTNWTYNNTSNVVVAGAQLAGDNNRSIAANYSPISYTITYNLAVGTNGEGNPATYTIESEAITLIAPTKPGYTFTGWTGSNGEEANTEVTIPAGSTGNLEYTANWTFDEATPNITNWNLLLSDRIGIRYQLNFANDEQALSYTIKFTINERTVTLPGSSAESGYWYTLYINALEMGDEVTLSLYNGETEVVRHDALSAIAYCERLEALGGTDKSDDLIKALHNYGYYMQNSGWEDGAEHTAISSPINTLSTDSIATITSALSDNKMTRSVEEGAGISNATVSVSFSDQSALNLYVTLSEGYEIESVTIDDVASTFTETTTTNKYQIKSGKITPTKLGDTIVINVVTRATEDPSTTYTSTYNASPLAYAKSLMNSTKESITTAKKLALIAYYNYYEAATAYLG